MASGHHAAGATAPAAVAVTGNENLEQRARTTPLTGAVPATGQTSSTKATVRLDRSGNVTAQHGLHTPPAPLSRS